MNDTPQLASEEQATQRLQRMVEATRRRQRMVEIVTDAAKAQTTADYRENYFRSCEAHNSPVLTEVVAEVRRLTV